MRLITLLFLLLPLNCFSATLNESLSLTNLQHMSLGKTALDFYKKIDLKNRSHLLFKFNKGQFQFDIDIEFPVDQTEAENILKSQIALIEIPYNDTPSPYAGVISNIEKCSTSLKPKIKKINLNSVEINVVNSFVGEKFESGICHKKKIKYHQCSAFFFRENAFHKVKIYSPLNIKCDRSLVDYITGLIKLK